MSEMKFNKLSPAQQQKIMKLIRSDFRKAKLLYNSYQKQTKKTENTT